jgi:hypothetical protein
MEHQPRYHNERGAADVPFSEQVKSDAPIARGPCCYGKSYAIYSSYARDVL